MQTVLSAGTEFGKSFKFQRIEEVLGYNYTWAGTPFIVWSIEYKLF